MTKEQSVLISCCGGELVPLVLRDIRKHHPNLKIIGVDMHPQPVAEDLTDAFYCVPHGKDDNYFQTILEIIELNKVDIIIPWSDEEVITLAHHKKILDHKGCTLAAPDIAGLNFSSNKENTYKELRNNGIAVPDFDIITNSDQLKSTIHEFTQKWQEFVIKPSCSRGGRDVFIVDTQAKEPFISIHNRQVHCDLDTFYQEYAPQLTYDSSYVIMEKLVAPAYDVDVLSWQGEAHCIIPRKRHNPDGLPYRGYTIEPNQEIIDIAKQVADHLKLSHLYDIDIMIAQDGSPRVMEVNPRPSGSIAYSHHAQIPVMSYLIDYLLGNKPNINTACPNISIYPFNDLLSIHSKDD